MTLPEDFHRRSAEILASPNFKAARNIMCDGYMALFEYDVTLNKILAEHSRYAIIMFAICLAAQQRDEDPASWLTLGRLQDVVGQFQIASPGRVEALVARLIDTGWMKKRPALGDARKRILVPTQPLLNHDMGMIRAQARACLLIGEGEALQRAANCDSEFERANAIVNVAAFVEAMTMTMKHTEMLQYFLMRDSGYMVLLSLAVSAQRSPDGTVSTIPYQEISRRFGISRAHVHNVVNDAQDAGLLRVLAPGRSEVELLPRLYELFDKLTADSLNTVERRFNEALTFLQENKAA
ncbi:MAG TPA: hypothetical protein PKB01_03490 [Xanthobacteraceae bacterium]|nr:hypothetical protein [Xanthobacteraceae bacterium]